MAKVALVADIHMGLGTRQPDIMRAVRTVSAYCKKNDITEIIVLGDLFHDRESISIEVLCDAFDFFSQCKEDGQQWIVFPGNHDMFLKHSWDVNSLRPFSDVLTIIETVKILDIDGRRFWILPFIYSETAYMRVLARIEEQYEEGDVLLTHIGVKSSILNVCFLLQDWSFVEFVDSKFDQVYTGHFHIKQQVGENVWYPGSLIPFKFDEGDVDHGFYVYDTVTGKHKFVDVWRAGKELQPREQAPPQYCTFHDSMLDDKGKGDVQGNMIRVAITRDYSPREREQIRERFAAMGARRVIFMDLVERNEEEVKVDDKLEAIKLDELFRRFMEADVRGVKGLRPNLLLQIEREVREEGDEIYSRIERD